MKDRTDAPVASTATDEDLLRKQFDELKSNPENEIKDSELEIPQT